MIEAKPDIMNVMEREGIELKQRGRDYWAPCPFHAEKTPSFKVSPVKQSFYCFGCGEHGDAIDFIQKHHSVNFKDALRILGIRKGRAPKPDPAKERKRRQLREFQNWERQRKTELSDEMRQCRAVIDFMGPDKLNLTYCIIEDMQAAEMQIDVLQNGTVEEKFALWRDIHGNI